MGSITCDKIVKSILLGWKSMMKQKKLYKLRFSTDNFLAMKLLKKVLIKLMS